jgi:hypothetical protein
LSARFAGQNCTFADNNAKLLKLLKGVPTEHRKARFRTILALALPKGATQTVEGRIDGYEIRSAAVRHGIPCVTTMTGATAAARAIAAARQGDAEVRSLQEIHAGQVKAAEAR